MLSLVISSKSPSFTQIQASVIFRRSYDHVSQASHSITHIIGNIDQIINEVKLKLMKTSCFWTLGTRLSLLESK